jgi:hypothetical protein
MADQNIPRWILGSPVLNTSAGIGTSSLREFDYWTTPRTLQS